MLAAIAGVARFRREAQAVVALQLAAALVTLAIALPVELHDTSLVAGWLVLALVATAIARRAYVRFTALAMMLVLAGYCTHGTTAALLACVLSMFAIERFHAPAASGSPFRTFAVAGVALGLLDLAQTVSPSGLHVLGWVAAAFVLFALGFALRAATYRWSGFVALALGVVRLLAIELRTFSADQRILTFVLGGVVMLAVSFAYARRRGKQ